MDQQQSIGNEESLELEIENLIQYVENGSELNAPISSEPRIDSAGPSVASSLEISYQEEKTQKKKESLFQYENKRLREAGAPYVGVVRPKPSGTLLLVDKPQREIQPPCPPTSSCRKTQSVFKCNQINDSARLKTFSEFWNLLSWVAKVIYVKAITDRLDPKNADFASDHPKSSIWKFYLKTEEGVKVRVCQKLFCSTISMPVSTIRRWLTKAERKSSQPAETTASKSSRAKRPPHEGKERAKMFISTLPTVPSHYCRSSCDKKFVEKEWKSIGKIYDAYIEQEDEDISVGLRTFERLFKEQDMAVQRPKKDQCSYCTELKVKGEDVLSTEHYLEQKAALAEKRRLKEDLKDLHNTVAFCADLESALPCPKLLCRAQFFKTKMHLHNFTTYDLRDRSVDCYVFTERDAGHDADVYASIFCAHLKKIVTEKANVEKVIIYSDSCGYQNKNQVLAGVFLNFSDEYKIVIEHRYLVSGHSHMEVDTYHSNIEKATRQIELFTPRDYIKEIATARLGRRKIHGRKKKSSKPAKVTNYKTEVHVLEPKFFKKFHFGYTKSIRPGTKAGDPTVAQVRAFRYSPGGKLEYKMKVNDNFTTHPSKIKRGPFPQPTLLHDKHLGLPDSKKRHIRELLPYIPEKKRRYYQMFI